MRLKKRWLAYLLLSLFMVQSVAAQDVFVPRPALPSELKSLNTSDEDEQVITSQVEESEESLNENEETSNSTTEKAESIMATEIVLYPLNEFGDEESKNNFAKFVKEDEELMKQVVLKDVSTNDRYLLEASYSENASEKNQLIVLYVPLEIEDKAKAEQAVEHNLLLFPDLLVQGETVEQENSYDLAFTVRPPMDPNAFEVDLQNNEVYYTLER